MATTKKSGAKAKPRAKPKPKAESLSSARIVKLSRSPSDADRVAAARALAKQLTAKERLAFTVGVIQGSSIERVCKRMGLTDKKEAEALIASASGKLG